VVLSNASRRPYDTDYGSAAPASGTDAESLIVSGDDVRRIANFDNLTPQT
jgi:hypothetical protein